MPMEAFQSSARQPARAAVVVSPPRLRPKGPVGPDFYRRSPAAAYGPKQSAVERLEADKSKYVKSQVALSRQRPVGPPEVLKPLLSPNTPLRPTRKTHAQARAKQEGVQLDLEHLSNLISDVANGPQPGAASGSKDGQAPEWAAHTQPPPCKSSPRQVKEKPPPPPRPDRPKERLKACGPAVVDGPSSPGAPAAGTVRRVDVMPQTGPGRAAGRPPQFMRPPLRPMPLHSKVLFHQTVSNLRVFQPRAAPGPSPLKPVAVPSKPDPAAAPPPPGAAAPAPAPPSLPAIPPPSPAITRLSSSSSKKRRSLTRSKSDMSDRYSRAGTELERFFNLCGLDPADLQDLTGSSSDIVSLARFRSVSAPGSECAGSDREGEEEEEEEEEDAGKAAGRVPYGISVIERNARVIKWLYGLRQAKDSPTKSTHL